MTQETTGFGLAPDPRYYSPTGELTLESRRLQKEQAEREREGELTLLDEGMRSFNTIYDVAANAAIEFGTEDDPNFDPFNEPGLYDNIPDEYHKELGSTGSAIEAWAKRGRIEQILQDRQKLEMAGFSGTAASLAASVIDADALLIPVSGGTYLGTKASTTLAKMGVKQGRLRGAVTGVGAGLEAGAITGGVGAAFGTATDATDVTSMMLGGMAFGGTIGAVIGKGPTSAYDQMYKAKAVHDEYIQAKARGFTPAGTMMSEAGSLSAGKVRMVDTPELRPSSKPWFDRAADDTNAINAMNILKGKMDSESTNIDNLVGRAAQKVQNWTDRSPLKSLYSEVAHLGVIGNKLAYDTLYHPGGIIDGSVPAAGYDAMYTQELSIPIQNYHNYAMEYMGKSTDGRWNRAKNMFTSRDAYNDFNRQVLLELETRYHDGGKGLDNVHESVKKLADDMDEMHKKAIDIQKGRSGEAAVKGSEDLEHRPGYFSRRWSGEQMAKFKEKDLVTALRESYLKLLPEGSIVDIKTLDSIVKSIVTRSKALDEGIDTNLVGLLRDGGKEFLRDTLKNNSLSDKQIQSIIDAFTGSAAERAKPGFLKKRIELDLRVKIPGTDKMLLDLLEPDLYKGMHYYTRKVSGTSALARKGYQLADKTEIIESIKDEMSANGFKGDYDKANDILETTFSYFGAGAVGEGVDPLLLSTMRLTRQSLLGSLGLTQMTELGNVILMSGVEATMKQMPKEMKAIFTGKKTPLVQELHDAFIFMDKDHILHDDQLALDITGKSTVLQNQYADSAYKAIAFGDKIAGHTSLFYQAMTFSQRLAMSSINHKLYKLLGKGELDANTSRRLLDVGLDDTMTEMLQDYINKGVITKVDGEVTMNFNKWNPDDLQDYKLAMHQFVNRAVQKNLPGEVPYWATKQLGRFMTQLRMFPIQAFQKQFLRNMRHADSTTAKALLFNLGMAAIVYSVSQIIKGRGDRLTTEKIAKGAINYAPTTGWLPMVSDPLVEIMGLPGFRMNKYGPPGRATDGIIPVPPAIPTMNRMLHLPGAVLGSFNGIDRQEASALSSIPIVGNMYGFSALFNYLKDN